MARIRTIKPEFWTDDRISECSLSARLLFIGTWNFCDDEGNLQNSPKQIKRWIFPDDNLDIRPLIVELIAHGLLIEYSVNEEKYLHIRGFKKHQLINRPSKPQHPLFDESLITHGILSEDSVTTHHGMERKGKEGKGVSSPDGDGCVVTTISDIPDTKPKVDRTNAREVEFEMFWRAYPKKVGKGAAERAFAKVPSGMMKQMLAAIELQKRSEQWLKDNGQYIPNPATWLNEKRWLDEVPVGGVSNLSNAGRQTASAAEEFLSDERQKEVRSDDDGAE